MAPRLPFSAAEQTVHVQLEKDNPDGPSLDIFLDVFDADTSKARMIILGKDGADDIVLHFARGGALESTEYRPQPEKDAGELNQKRNDRDIERIKAAKQAVADFEEKRHDDPVEGEPPLSEPDEHTKTLARMDIPAEPGPHPEPVTRTVELGADQEVRRSPRANITDAPAHPDEGKPEDDPRRGLPPGDTGDAQRPSGLEPKDGDVVTTTTGPRTRPAPR